MPVLLRAGVVISSKKRQATALLIGLAAALIAAGPVVADPPTIASKRAEEQQVLNQIQQLDVSLEKAINAYEQANLRLGQINHDLSVNKHDLGVARNNLRTAERTLYDPGSRGASLFADKFRTTPAEEVIRLVRATDWFRAELGADDVIYMKLNCEGAEADIVADLLDSGELSRVRAVMIDPDVRKIPSQAHRERELRQRLAASGLSNEAFWAKFGTPQAPKI